MGKHSQRPQQPAPDIHSHGGPAPKIEVGPWARVATVLVLIACCAATLFGLAKFYPNDKTTLPKADFAAPGVTFPTGTVTSVRPGCGDPNDPGAVAVGASQRACGQLDVRLDSGPGKGTSEVVQIGPEVLDSGIRKGDRVDLMRLPGGGGVEASYSFFGLDRKMPIGILTLAFVILVGLVARLRGLLSLVGLVFAGLVIWKFMLPALLQGHSGVGVALTGSAAIMFVVLYLAHGLSLRTSTALLGTLVGIGLTTLLGSYAVSAGRLSGVGEEAASLLGAQVPLDFQGLFLCTVIIASLGVLNDVTITQASAIWELRAAAPEMSRRQLFQAGMRIGRDHIASTVYTIVFAYAGAALAVLLLISLYDRPLMGLLNAETIAEEVLRTLAGAIGLVLAVPITTAIGSVLAGSGHSGKVWA